MKIRRYFTYQESERTGELGLLPLWIPRSAEFDPNWSLLGVLHDTLDHQLRDRGLPHEEIMAFGRILATRVAHGCREVNSIDGMGAELVSLLCDVYQGENSWRHYSCMDDLLPTVPRTGALDSSYLAGNVGSIVESFARSMRNRVSGGQGDDPIDAELRPTPVFYTKVASLLKIGVLDAQRRYDSRRASHVAYLFDQTSDGSALGKRFRHFVADVEEGDIVTITIDLDECNVRWHHVERDELGRLPEWARIRQARWHSA